MKINIDPFLKACLILTFFCLVPALTITHHHNRDRAKIAKVKSRLKQIGTTVAMYYTDTRNNKYPKDPSAFNIDPSLIYTEKTTNWFELSINSPYIFFPNQGDEYTGSADKPLAMNWEPFPIPPYYLVVWEDGHVSSVSPEEAEKMINSSIKNQMTRLLYKLTFRKNLALQ